MKKLVLILASLMILTGCQSLDTMREQEQEEQRFQIIPYTEQVMDKSSDAAKVLERYLSGRDDENNIYMYYGGNDLAEQLGVNTSSLIVRVDLTQVKQREDDFALIKKNEVDFKMIKEIIGDQLQSFIDEANSHKEEIYFTEKVIGNYGVAYYKSGDYAEELYIVPSQQTYLDEAKRNQIKTFCGEQLIVTATTAGKEKSMVELSFPSYQVRYHTIGLNNTTAYYQVFSDKNNEIEKIRLVINQCKEGYKEGELEEDKLLPLRRMLEEMQIGTEGEMKVIQAIDQVINQKSDKQKGTLDNLEYMVNRSGGHTYNEDLIEVEISF